MKYKIFLNEINKTERGIFDAVKDYIKDYSETKLSDSLYRGASSMGSTSAIIKQSDQTRTPKLASLFITALVDGCLKEVNQNAPSRRKAVICANKKNKEWAESFGTLYRAFPKDGTLLAYVKSSDFNKTSSIIDTEYDSKLFLKFTDKDEFNSLDDIEKLILSKFASMDEYYDEIYTFKGLRGSLKDNAEKILKIFGIGLVDNVSKLPYTECEVWFDGDCLITNDKYFHEFKAYVEMSLELDKK